MDAVRSVWPERLPLTMRLGSDDFNEHGVQFDDAVHAVATVQATVGGCGTMTPTQRGARAVAQTLPGSDS